MNKTIFLMILTLTLWFPIYKNHRLLKKVNSKVNSINNIDKNIEIVKQDIQRMYTEPLTRYKGILTTDKNGFDFLLIGGDNCVCKDILSIGLWEPHVQNTIRKLVKPNDKVLILGGHIGFHAVLVSKLIGDNGKLSVFEANPNTFKFLRINMDLNNIQNAKLYPFAAFSKNTDLNFLAATAGNTGASHLEREMGGIPKDNPDLVSVKAVAIDSINEIKTIDILQMDIEGAEPDAVYGATKLIDNSPNLIVIQEWSPNFIKSDTLQSYLNFWRSRGYKIAKIDFSNKLEELSDEQLINDKNQIDIVLAKNLDEILKKFN